MVGQDLAALKERVRGGGAGAAGGSAAGTGTGTGTAADDGKDSVWYPPRGGLKRGLLGRMVGLCVEGDERTRGVGWEVLEGLAGVGGGDGRG